MPTSHVPTPLRLRRARPSRAARRSAPRTIPAWPFQLEQAGRRTPGPLYTPRRLWLALIVLPLLALLIGVYGIGAWFDVPPQVAAADALVILGGDTPQRLEPGVDLYRQGLAGELWYTGTHVHARSALREAVRMGVPRDATTQLHGANTWEEAQRIAAELEARNLDSILVVTSWYHGRRTLCTLHHHLRAHDAEAVQVYYQPVYEAYNPILWWRAEQGRAAILSELAKFLYYGLHYGLNLFTC